MSVSQPLPLTASILLTVGSGYFAISLHELTHWVVAGIWTDKAVIRFDYLIIPSYVDFQGVELPSMVIRAIGIAPMVIWLVPTYVFVNSFVVPSFVEYGADSIGFALLPLCGVVLTTSPSDLLAAFFPSAWRERYPAEETSYELSHQADLSALVREIQKRI